MNGPLRAASPITISFLLVGFCIVPIVSKASLPRAGFAISTSPGAIQAQTGAWTTSGPNGGQIFSILIDPRSSSTVYVGSYGGGVFKSTDNGASWAQINSTLTFSGERLTTLAMDPTNSNILYEGASELLKSTDAGATWAAPNPGLNSPPPNCLAINPANSNILYAGTVGSGVFLTTDAGVTWVQSGLTQGQVNSVVLNPSSPSTVYAGIANQGVLKSTDSGATWTKANSGLSNLFVTVLAVDAHGPDTLYCGAAGAGVFFKSTDAGGSWTQNAGLDSRGVAAIALDPTNSNNIYAGLQNGLFKSTDGGATWAQATTGLISGNAVQSIAISPTDGATVFAGLAGAGLFKSTDGANSFAQMNSGLFAGVQALAISPAAPGAVYAAGIAQPEGGAIFKQTGAAGPWTEPDPGFTVDRITALAIDPLSPNTVYAASDTAIGIFKTTDGGATWTRTSSGLGGKVNAGVAAITIDPANPARIYVGSLGLGVFRTTTSGTRWKRLNSGLTSLFVQALVLDPTNSANVYIGTAPTGAFKSTDGGEAWTQMNLGPEVGGVTLAVDPNNPATIYAGTGNSGVLKSTDAGATWSPINSGLLAALDNLSLPVTGLAVDPTNSSHIYAGSGGAGVFASTDAGATWASFGAGLANPFVNAMALNPATPQTLYAGTNGGVFQIQIGSNQDFSLSFASPTIAIAPGSKAKVSLNITRLAGIPGAVTVTPPSAPTGIIIKPGPVSANGNSVAFTIKVRASVGAGTQNLVFTGADESGNTNSATLVLQIK